MASPRKTSTLGDPFKLTILIFAIVAAMYLTAEVLKPLALAILLSFALAPVSRLLERAGSPRAVAVVLTVAFSLVLLGGVGYVVGRQLTSLANRLPGYHDNIEAKLNRVVKPREKSAAAKLQEMADQVAVKFVTPPPPATESASPPRVQKVEVVEQPSFQERLRTAIGPYLEFLGIGSFVLILVLFMLMGREDLADRIVGLFGHRQVSLTTRTMEEIGQRISRYLATFSAVNSGYGLVVGVGLALIGVPYAVLWGCLAAMLRFIPYVGPGVAFVLPLVFSFAHFEGWAQPLEVFALFAVIEVVLNSFLEPIIYGKTTGISALGLLVAAMFWTWLWGSLGLLLSTPLTVCLAVLGKYVPGLRFFSTLLGEEAELEPDVRFYQRLVALDREGAVAIVEEASKSRPKSEVFDRILIPTLSYAERDVARDELGEQEQEFVWQVVGEIVENLESVPEVVLRPRAPTDEGAPLPVEDASHPAGEAPVPGEITILGVAANDTADVLALKMLAQLVTSAGFALEVVVDAESPLQVAQRVAERSASLVVVSHLPPEGLTQARYLVRRLRAQFSDLPLVVGRWGESGGAAAAAERLSTVGASHVVFTLADARDLIVEKVSPATPRSDATSSRKLVAAGPA